MTCTQAFTIVEYMGIRCARASLAKALFDYLYLRPIPVEVSICNITTLPKNSV